jgi:chemotaxis protein methyltransferase CheR
MSDNDFNKVSLFIYNEVGIKMPPEKKVLLENRRQKRLRELKMTNFSDYIEFLFSKKGIEQELISMIDVITTNKTDFFRESVHFNYLTDIIIPELQQKSAKQFRVWSAGCSSGEEPYTIAITLQGLLEKNVINDYSIYATDISTIVLDKARQAVYPSRTVDNIPLTIKKKYFLKSTDPENKYVCIIPELKRRITFQRFNFMNEAYKTPHTFDVIFCRNVIIYFDRKTQENVIAKLCTKLNKGGYLFLGHSESITNMNLPLESIKPTVFKKI